MTTNSNKIKAMGIVAGVSTIEENERLKAELAEAKAALATIEMQGEIFEEKYSDLVWMARKHQNEILTNPSHPSHDCLHEMLRKYPRKMNRVLQRAI